MQTHKEVAEHLRWRYATKKFNSQKKINESTWKKIEESLILTPSSFGLQPWKFVVVTDQAVKEELVGATMGQRQPAECSHLVVICRLREMTDVYILNYLERMSEVRNVPMEKLDALRKVPGERSGNPRLEHLAHVTFWERAVYRRVVKSALQRSSAVSYIPNTVSYGALLVVINERLKLPRTLEEQKYFVDLANQLIKLYWQQVEEEQSYRRKAA